MNEPTHPLFDPEIIWTTPQAVSDARIRAEMDVQSRREGREPTSDDKPLYKLFKPLALHPRGAKYAR